MNKRTLFSIPITGLALTSFGCGDKIDALAGTFVADTIANVDVPLNQLAVDIYGDGTLICDNSLVASNITFDDALAGGTLTINYDSINCLLNGVLDPASDISIEDVYDADVAVVTANTNYTITLTDQGGVTNALTCTLAGNALSCTDEAAAVFAFTQQ